MSRMSRCHTQRGLGCLGSVLFIAGCVGLLILVVAAVVESVVADSTVDDFTGALQEYAFGLLRGDQSVRS